MIRLIKDNVVIIKDFFKIAKGKTSWVVLLFLSSIFTHISSLIIPIFAANIILFVTEGNFDSTYWNIIYLAIVFIFYNLFRYLNRVAYSNNTKYSCLNLRAKIIDKISSYDSEFTDKISRGTVLNTFDDDVGNITEMFDIVCEMIVVFAKVIVFMIIFLSTNIYIGLFVLLLEFLYLKSYDYCNIKTSKYLKAQKKYGDKLNDQVNQVINGSGEIEMLNIFDKIKHNFNIIANKWSGQYMKKRKYINTKERLLPFVIHIGKIVLYIVLAVLVLNGYYGINILILLISYFENAMTNSEELMQYSGQIREYSVSIKRVDAVLNYSNHQQIEFGVNENDYINGLVEFKNVSFTYKPKIRTEKEKNIRNISFEARSNEITALVGYLGSGKTTIANLLLRRYKINSGHIYIDGEDIYSYSKNVYASNVACVDQTPFVFNMSIRKNLNLVDSNIENQIEACKRVGIHDYIMKLPNNYNTILSENSANFSEGYKQLLSIARILLSKAEILIFDEVTRSLDTLLVERIKKIFDDLKQDHTIIVITHNKDIMNVADKVIVLDDGKIIGQGTHEQLMNNNECYINLQTYKICLTPNKEIKEDITNEPTSNNSDV